MQRPSGTEPRLFLKDDEGNYYVQTASMKEPVRVPDENKREVEEVISGRNERAGFVQLEGLALRPVVVVKQVDALGACRGECGLTFGVLGEQEVR
jgi:hypothetical protein